MQMTPPSYTTLTTVRKSDKNMMEEINSLLKITPHILIFWRPDISSFKAYMLKAATLGAKVEQNATASLLPSIAGREKGAQAFKLMSSTLTDDSEALGFLCPLQTEASLSSSWASVDGEGRWNVTGAERCARRLKRLHVQYIVLAYMFANCRLQQFQVITRDATFACCPGQVPPTRC